MRKTYTVIAALVILLATTSAQAQIQSVNDSELSKVSGQYAEIGIRHFAKHLVYNTAHIVSLVRDDICSAHQKSLALASGLASNIIKTKPHHN